MSPQFLDRHSLWQALDKMGLTDWSRSLQQICESRWTSQRHGNLDDWHKAWKQLPCAEAKFLLNQDAIQVILRSGHPAEAFSQADLQKLLMKFHPWRKGPWELLGVPIDSEWRSDWKWNRLADKIDFDNKRILDVGCGNGYYGWRMLGAGARTVLGCEPFLLSVAQFEVVRKYWMQEERHWIIPLADTDLPRELSAFDLTLSMGVLYHRPNPIEHLQILHSTLRPRGRLVLETIVLTESDSQVLMPEVRYAKMRNVWFIPSIEMLQRWLRRVGFEAISVLDVTQTTIHEQRRTAWMRFESLSDFLDPQDHNRTIEGYPAPVRALLTAEKRSY